MAKRCLLLLIVLAKAYRTFVSAQGKWSYDNPTEWEKISGYETCGGSNQSPINIDDKSTKYDNIGPFAFTGTYGSTTSLPDFIFISNNGHTVQVDVTGKYGFNVLTIKSAGLPSTYQLQQLHMHWGSVDTKGSEHTLNGQAFPLEIHFVHFDSEKYNNITAAVDQPNGLAVIGVFVQLGDSGQSNAVFDAMVSTFSAIKYAGNTTTLSAFNLSGLMPDNKNEFYRYSGSLTTPPCYESVIWTVMKNPITISKQNMDALRTMLLKNAQGVGSDVQLVDNIRPVQALNGRKVIHYFVSSTTRTSSFAATKLLVITAVTTSLVSRYM